MASSTYTGALYGTGIFGTAEYGVVAVSVVPDGSQASGTADTDIIISGDALHNITSVQGVVSNGGVGDVTAAASIALGAVSVEATGSVGDVEALNNARPTFDGVEGTSQLGSETVTASAVVDLPSPTIIGAGVDQAIVTAASVVVPTGSEGTTTLGNISQLTVNRVPVSGVEATGTIDTGFVAANNARPTFDGVEGTSAIASVGDYVVVAKAVVAPTGLEATGTADDDLVFIGLANIELPSAEGTGATGTVSIDATRNVFAVANRDYKRQTYVIEDEPRIVYVKAA